MNLLTLSAESYRRSHRYLRHGPGHFLMYVLGRFRMVRSCMVWLYGQRAHQPHASTRPSLLESVDVDNTVLKIRQDGVATGVTLRQEVVDQLLAFASMASWFGDGKDDLPFHMSDTNAAGQSFRLGMYKNALRASPVVQALASDPALLAIARGYLGAEPVLHRAAPSSWRRHLIGGQA